jgi:hypothetical protein
MDPSKGIHAPQGLATLGAVLQVEVNLPQPLIEFLGQQGRPIPAPYTGTALIDTGASMTCVDESVLTNLGINAVGLVSLGTAAGLVQRPLFPARLAFPEPKLNVDLSRVVAVDLRGQNIQGMPLIALIGRDDILRVCQFIYDGSGGFFTLSF